MSGDGKAREPRRFRPVRTLLVRVLVAIGGMGLLAGMVAYALNPQAGLGGNLGGAALVLAAFAAFAVVLLVKRSSDARRRWSITAEVGDFASVAKDVLSADIGQPLPLRREAEYCLLLRPFGSDGSTLCVGDPGRKRYSLLSPPTPTLEQVIDWTVRRTLGMRTLAVVNQNARYTPAGPHYLACPNDHWQCQVGELVMSAHTIFLVLPPGQDLRTSFRWELEQITQYGMNARIVVILPHPWNNTADGSYLEGRRIAARIMALLVKLFGRFDEVSENDAAVQARGIPPATVMIKMLDVFPHQFLFQVMPRARWTREPLSRPYAVALERLLTTQAREMQLKPLREIYRWRLDRHRRCACSR